MGYLYVLIAFVGVVFTNPEFSERNHFRLRHETVKTLVTRIKNFKDEPREFVIISNLADQIYKEISAFLIQYDRHFYEIPDMDFVFQYKIFLSTYHGQLGLKHGLLHGMSTLHRQGNAVLSKQNSFANIKLPIAFNNLTVDYSYSADIMNRKPAGSVRGEVYDVTAQIEIYIDLHHLKAEVEHVRVKAGKLSLQFQGRGMVYWIENIFTDVTSNVLRDRILQIAHGVLDGIARDINNQINDEIRGTWSWH